MKIASRLACLLSAFLLSVPLCGQAAARDQLVLVVNRAPQVLSVFKAEGPTLTLVKKDGTWVLDPASAVKLDLFF